MQLFSLIYSCTESCLLITRRNFASSRRDVETTICVSMTTWRHMLLIKFFNSLAP